MDPYCLNNTTSKEWGGLSFKHRPVIPLHLPQCMFVCTFVSEIREHGHLITQEQLSDTTCALFSHYSMNILYIRLQSQRASVYLLHTGCLQKLKLLWERLLKKHTCPFQIILKYHILFLLFLAPCPCFSSMVARPPCSLKVKEKPRWMCPLSGLLIHSQMTLFFSRVAYKSYTCKNGTESSKEGHNILPEYIKNEWSVVCIAGSGQSSG